MLDGLERATHRFAARFGGPGPVRDEAEVAHLARAEEAEREARAHLERARERAEALIEAMLAAVEAETALMRDEAEAGIQLRWSEAEEQASRYVGDARKVSEAMVLERQSSLGRASDEIAKRADALTAGMEDAEEIRAQFGRFVAALSQTAGSIASEHGVEVADVPEPEADREAGEAPEPSDVGSPRSASSPDALAA